MVVPIDIEDLSRNPEVVDGLVDFSNPQNRARLGVPHGKGFLCLAVLWGMPLALSMPDGNHALLQTFLCPWVHL